MAWSRLQTSSGTYIAFSMLKVIRTRVGFGSGTESMYGPFRMRLWRLHSQAIMSELTAKQV